MPLANNSGTLDKVPKAISTQSGCNARSVTSAVGVTRNALYVSSTQLVFIPLSLLVTGYMIRRMGLQTYGGWAVMSVLLGYVGLIEFGMRVPLTKYVAEYHASGDIDSLNRIVNVTLAYFLAIATAAALGLIAVGPWAIDNLIKVDIPRWQVVVSYVFAVLTFCFNLVFSVFGAMLIGLQRYDIDSKLNVASRLANAFGGILVLYLGWGLPGLSIQQFVVMLLVNGIYVACCFRLLPNVRYGTAYFHMVTFRKMFSFSAQIQVARLSILLNDQFGKTMLAYFLGPTQVAYFQVADGICDRLRGVPMSIIGTITPAASDLVGAGRHDKLIELYHRSLRYVSLVSMPLIAGAIVFAQPFLDVWLGPGYEISANTLIIVASSYVVWISASPGGNVLMGLGKPKYETWATVLRMALNVSLTTSLMLGIGYYGAPLGIAISLVVGNLFLLAMTHRALGLSPFDTIRKCLAGAALAATGASAIARFLLTLVPSTGWPELIGAGIVYSALYSGAVALFVGDEYDRNLVRRGWESLKPGRIAEESR